MKISYGDAIREGFEYLLQNHSEVFIFGQGVWSPWYVGNTMKDLEKTFGKERVIDSPVSELACTGAAVGASLFGMRPIVIHPRMDFMILAADAMVNQAAKWGHMLGGAAYPAVTIRSIINRGGEQGAQHSQSLQSWFAHIPGLRVVMPFSPLDARDLLIASVLSNDPVLYIDDRWLYETEEEHKPVRLLDLSQEGPAVVKEGADVTLVGMSHSTHIAMSVKDYLLKEGISSEIIDIRVLNPFDPSLVIRSVKKTGRLVVLDESWKNCGFASEVIASVTEALNPCDFKMKPLRFTLPSAPAPTSLELEKKYYLNAQRISEKIIYVFKKR